MSEGIGCYISLKGQLKLCNDSLIQGEFECDVRNGDFFGEPTLYFQDPEPFGIFINKTFYILNSFNNILDLQKSALASDHITDRELDILPVLQLLLDFLLIFCILSFQIATQIFFILSSFLWNLIICSF